MKNIYKIAASALLFISIYSCEDAIDIDQPGRLASENAFQSISDLRSGLLGTYNFLDTTSEIGFTASFTDEANKGRDNGGQNSSEQNANINSSNGYAENIWIENYSAIGLANRVLSAAQNISSAEDETEYNNVVGQAHAIRAYAHFKILTFFSTDYTDNDALAGVLLTSPTTDIFASRARNTNGEFYDQIESDLNTAASLITTNEGNTFMGQDFITALRARIAAYKGDYATADTYAASLLADYQIATQAQYFQMYEDNDDTEIIFKLERNVGDSFDGQGTAGGGWAGSLFAFIDNTDGGGPFMEMSRSVYNIMAGSADVRLARNLNELESTFDADYATNDNFINDDVLLVNKYPGGIQPLLNDLKVFRSSEMLLIRAEAAANAGDYAGVSNYIKTIRDARFGTATGAPTYTTEAEAFGGILDERRLEFLFEGHRWVDLKRLGQRGNRNIDKDARECSFFAVCSLDNNDYRFTLPVPLSEFEGNSAMVQNTGY